MGVSRCFSLLLNVSVMWGDEFLPWLPRNKILIWNCGVKTNSSFHKMLLNRSFFFFYHINRDETRAARMLNPVRLSQTWESCIDAWQSRKISMPTSCTCPCRSPETSLFGWGWYGPIGTAHEAGRKKCTVKTSYICETLCPNMSGKVVPLLCHYHWCHIYLWFLDLLRHPFNECFYFLKRL